MDLMAQASLLSFLYVTEVHLYISSTLRRWGLCSKMFWTRLRFDSDDLYPDFCSCKESQPKVCLWTECLSTDSYCLSTKF